VVTVRLSGSGPVTPATAIVPPCRTDVCADVVSVSVDASRLPGGGTSGELVIELGAERSQGGPGLGLAAVALR
jgi:hypothetical protein